MESAKQTIKIGKQIIEPEEKKKLISEPIKYSLYFAIGVIAICSIGAGIGILKLAGLASQEQSLLTLIYILGGGWMVAIILLALIIIARKEVWLKIKTFGRKSKMITLRLIGCDANENDIILPLKGNTAEIGENKVIINPRKTTMKDGMRVITYVANNALAHDYSQNPNETLKAIGKRLSENKDEDFHDIYSDPVRIDAKYFSETFLAAQQTSPDILNKIITFLTSKNIIIMLGAIAIAAGFAALLALQNGNILNSIPFCNPTQITP